MHPALAKRKVKLIFTDDPASKIAGQCWMSSNTIELNLAYFPGNEAEMLNQILGHEVCHLIHENHSPKFKKLLVQMGLRPETYHTLTVKE